MKASPRQCAETSEVTVFPLSISQLAEAACTTVHTVRNYLCEGLLECAQHTRAGYCLFDQCALDRLRLIRAARNAGLLLIDIKPLVLALNARNEGAVRDTMATLQCRIVERQDRLSMLDAELNRLAGCAHNCPR